MPRRELRLYLINSHENKFYRVVICFERMKLIWALMVADTETLPMGQNRRPDLG